MYLTEFIESSELQFKQLLEDYFITVYDEKSLPSHGIEHHRRVWSYAKELIICIEKQLELKDLAFIENLLIACYLHDIGMSVDPGIIHGHHSKELCIKFLDNNNLDNKKSLLSAIENHDNKEYKSTSGEYDLLTILSVADDLDAFGFIGIYRYIEIYLARSINFREIGYLITDNAKRRFENFVNIFGTNNALVFKQRARYNILNEFFSKYNDQVKSYHFNGQNPTGYCGVLEIFSDAMNKKISLEEIARYPQHFTFDAIICWFFNGLHSELKCDHRSSQTP